jgi:hypothetical protein
MLQAIEAIEPIEEGDEERRGIDDRDRRLLTLLAEDATVTYGYAAARRQVTCQPCV